MATSTRCTFARSGASLMQIDCGTRGAVPRRRSRSTRSSPSSSTCCSRRASTRWRAPTSTTACSATSRAASPRISTTRSNACSTRTQAVVNENANKDADVFNTQRDLTAGMVGKAIGLRMLPDARGKRPPEGRHSLPRPRLPPVCADDELLPHRLREHAVARASASGTRRSSRPSRSDRHGADLPDHRERLVEPVRRLHRQPHR